MITRRQLLRGSAVGLAGLALHRAAPAGALPGTAGARALVSGPPAPFTVRLPLLPELTAAHVRLVAAETDVPLLQGPPTRMWTFNGSFPGPVIRRPSGEPTRVTVVNALPTEAGSLTIHQHGAHAASAEDGQPETNVVEPGRERTYIYEYVEDGEPERAALQWYHDHSHHRTARNVWRGLAGLVVLEDDVEKALGLPDEQDEILLVVTDRAFDGDNQLTDPFTAPDKEQQSPATALGPGYPPFDETPANVVLVNGAVQPYVELAPRTYRLRVLNASGFKPYNLALSDGAPLVQIGTESGLLPAPVTRQTVLLGPAERADLLLDLTGSAGQDVVLESVPVTGGSYVPKTAPAVDALLQMRVRGTPAAPVRAPAALRPLPEWVDEVSDAPDRIWAFGLGTDEGGRLSWTINGRTFDHERVDARPELGSVETWLLVNATPYAMSHYIHIHDVDWVVLQRNGAAPEAHEAALKETFRLDPGETVLIASKFTDHLGPYMIHCHMLDHEDHGMMTTFEVVEPGQGDLPAGAVPGLPAALERSVEPWAQGAVRTVLAGAVAGRPAPVPLTDGGRSVADVAALSWCMP
jgi:spore coat protein A, manganese oxidase